MRKITEGTTGENARIYPAIQDKVQYASPQYIICSTDVNDYPSQRFYW